MFGIRPMNNVLLDTNVLIYSIDQDSRFFNKSQNIIKNNDLNLFTTIKNISELLSVITRFEQNNIDVKEAISIVKNFESITTLLYPNYNSYKKFKKLVNKYEPTGVQVHDFEIISISLDNNINNIATFDTKDFKNIDEISLYPI